MCYTTAILIEWICDGQLCAWINLADYNFNNSICCARTRKETQQDHNHIPQQPQMATKINKMILVLANFIASYTILLEGRVIGYCRAFPHMVLCLMQWGSHPILMPPWLLEQWNHLALCLVLDHLPDWLTSSTIKSTNLLLSWSFTSSQDWPRMSTPQRKDTRNSTLQNNNMPTLPASPSPFGTGFGKRGPTAICLARAFSYWPFCCSFRWGL